MAVLSAHYGKNSGSGIAEQRKWTKKFLKIADQREAEALFLISEQAEAEGK